MWGAWCAGCQAGGPREVKRPMAIGEALTQPMPLELRKSMNEPPSSMGPLRSVVSLNE